VHFGEIGGSRQDGHLFAHAVDLFHVAPSRLHGIGTRDETRHAQWGNLNAADGLNRTYCKIRICAEMEKRVLAGCVRAWDESVALPDTWNCRKKGSTLLG
jgi:hypothetical protein